MALERIGAGTMQDLFNRMAAALTRALGSPLALTLAFSVVLVWALSGPFFGFSDTWQLIINTGTTVVTFLMVFVIQNAQNRDAKAVHAKLDELIHALGPARDELVNAENEPEEVLDRQIAELRALADSTPQLRDRLTQQLGDLARRTDPDAEADPGAEAGDLAAGEASERS